MAESDTDIVEESSEMKVEDLSEINARSVSGPQIATTVGLGRRRRSRVL